MDYNEVIERFITTLEATAPTYDWIDGPDEQQIGLDHIDPEDLNTAAFEVDISIPTEFLDADEVDECDADFRTLADNYGVDVRISEANPDNCVYTFSLHSLFIGGNPDQLGRNN